MELWINPSCTKCRVAKAELDAAVVARDPRTLADVVARAAERST